MAMGDTFDSDMVTILTNVMHIRLNNDVAIALLGLGYNKWMAFWIMLPKDVDELKKDDKKWKSPNHVGTTTNRRTIPPLHRLQEEAVGGRR